MGILKIIRPRFEDGVLLTTERMKALSQQGFGFCDYSYKDYSDGIISGCGLRVEEKTIIVETGVFKYQGQVFLLENEVDVLCEATDCVTYLKLVLKEAVEKLGEVTYCFEIGLSEEKTQEKEIELCRFRLQKGARLRDCYDGFDDMMTEFDTINLIHCPYASKGTTTLHPKIVRQYAKELVAMGTNHILDQHFCIHILDEEKGVTLDSICAYLKFRDEIELERITNSSVYQAFNNILEAEKKKTKEAVKQPIQRRMIMVD